MSYSKEDAILELEQLVDEALEERDIEKALQIKNIYAKVGNEDGVEFWSLLARRWEREDDAHDQDK
jgi:hypothetical protein